LGVRGIVASGTDQFQQLVRAVAGLPLAEPRRHSDVKMVNLVGEDVKHLDGYLTDPAAHIHLYGKAEARPGRKMGHLTATGATVDEALGRVTRARDALLL
jgi:5-(carboxyamino)imidazole ribonucleotide synthase